MKSNSTQPLSGNFILLRIVLFALLFTGNTTGYCQLSSNYLFSTGNNGSLLLDMNSNILDMTGGTTQLIGSGQDNSLSQLTSIGFDFYFMGSCMKTFSCTDNGIIELGNRSVPVTLYNPSSNATQNLLAPYGKNLQVGTNGEVRYKLFGSAPNRVLVIEYFNVMISFLSVGGATPGGSTFQVRLYESTGIFEFVYGAMNTNNSSLNSSLAEVGWLQSMSANKFMSVANAHVATTSGTWIGFIAQTSGTVLHLHSTANGSRRYYRFTPPQSPVLPPSVLTLSSVSPGSVNINWTDSSTNEKCFNVFRSIDSVNFIRTGVVVSSTSGSLGTGYSQTISGLTPNADYTFRVVSNSEGIASVFSDTDIVTPEAKAYHWKGSGLSLFTDPNNWNPLRLSPDPTDTLYFANGVTSAISNFSTQSVARIVVDSNTVVSLTSAIASTLTLLSKSAKALEIKSGSSITFSSPASITIAFSAGSPCNASIDGLIEIGSNATYNTTNCFTNIKGRINSSGIISGSSLITMTFDSAGIYNHKFTNTPGVIPLSTWRSGSTCLISGYTTNAVVPGGIVNQSFSNLIWNCASQTSALNFNGVVPAFIESLSIVNTNTGSVSISNNSSPVFVMKDFNQSGGTFQLNTLSGATQMKVSGVFSQTGGTFSSSQSGNPVLEFNGSSGIQNVSFNNAAPAGSLTYKISNPSGINLGVAGNLTQYFNLNNGGGIRIATGAANPINSTLTLFYNSTGTTLTYESPVSRTMTVKEFPAQGGPFNLSVNMPGLVVTMPFTRIVTGTLSMSAGDIDIGSNSITIGTSASSPGGLAWSSGNIRLTTGSMTRWFTTIGLPTSPGTTIGFFPVANGPDNRNVSIYGSAQLSAGGFLTVAHNNLPGIVSGLSVNDGSYVINRRTNSSWTFTSGGILTTGSTLGVRITAANLFTSPVVSNLRLMKANSIAGNFVQGSGTIPNYRAERNAMNVADLNNTFYVGSADNNLEAIYVAVVDGNWSNPSIWSSGIVPAINNNSSIANGVDVIVDVNAQCKSLSISPNATLTVPANLLVVDSVVINNGAISVSGGDLSINGGTTGGQGLTTSGGSTFSVTSGNLKIGPAGGGNKRWTNAGGTINISGGASTINGNLLLAGGVFNQTGGNIFIDGNDGNTSSGSVADGSSLFQLTDGVISASAGTITITDPPFSSTTSSKAISLNSILTDTNAFTDTHTFIFGDGSSTVQGNSTNGFVIDTKENSGRIPLNNVVINSGAAPGRFVRNSLSSANGMHIKGSVIIGSGSSFRIIAQSNGRDCIGGDLVNSGTMISTQPVTFGGEPGIYSVTTQQTVSGPGTFINSTGLPTANFNGISINNSGGLLILIGDVTVSNNLNFISGNILISPFTLFALQGLTVTGFPSSKSYVVGKFDQAISTGSFNVLYPVGDDFNYTPVTLTGIPGSVLTPGNISLTTIAGDHPSIAGSGINSQKNLNRYYGLEALNGISFSPGTITGVFTYPVIEKDSGANSSNFISARSNSPGWITTTVGTKTDSSTQVINVSSLGDFIFGEPCATIAAVPHVTQPSCNGIGDGAISLSLQGLINPSFQWTGPNNFSSTQQNISALFPGNYTVVISGAGGCTSAINITINTTATIAATATTTNVTCKGGQTGKITITGTGGMAPYRYSVDSGVTFFSNPQFISLIAGTYFIVIKDSLNCLSSATAVTISEPSTPLTLNYSVHSAACFGSSNGSIQLSGAGGNSPYQYSKNNGTNFQSSGNFNNLAAGIYDCVLKDSNNCILSPLPVSVNSPPQISFSHLIQSPVCGSLNSGSITFLNVAGGNGGSYNFSINGGSTWRATSQFDSLLSGNYQLKVRDSSGCTSTSLSVTVNPSSQNYIIQPSAGSNGSVNSSGTDTVICGQSKTYQFTPDTCYKVNDVVIDGVSAGPLSSYTFSNVNADHTLTVSFIPEVLTIQSSSGAGGTISPSGTIGVSCRGNQSFVITPSSGFIIDSLIVDGVTVSTSTTYTFNDIYISHSIYVSFTTCTNPAIVNAGADDTICAGQSVSLSGTIGGSASSATWSTNGTGTFNPSPSSFSATAYIPSQADIDSGKVKLFLTSDDPTGSCNAVTDFLIVKILPLPQVSVTGSSGFCSGGQTVLQSNLISSNGPVSTFQWKRNTSIISGSNGSMLTANIQGSYSVIVTDHAGCTNESPLFSLSEFALPSPPTITAFGNSSFCIGDSVQLHSNKPNGNSWLPLADTTQSIYVSTAGIFSARYTDSNGCTSSPSNSITTGLLPLPVVTVSGDSAVCLGSVLHLTSSSPSEVSYSWTGPNGFSSGVFNPSFPVAYADSGLYRVTINDSTGCIGTGSLFVKVKSLPSVVISGNALLCTGASNLLSSISSPGSGIISGYQWKFNGNDIQGATANNYLAAQPGSYSLLVTNSFGCEAISQSITLSLDNSPLHGTYTISGATPSCTNYNSFSNVFDDLNSRGINGAVVFNVSANFSDHAPTLGLNLKMCSLPDSLQSSSLRSITFRKSGSGANPVIIASPGSSTLDGIIKITGTDYVTFDGIDLKDPVSNVNSNMQMEFGYALLKCDGTNGANHNTIKNCTITLQKINASSTGIYLNNHTDFSNVLLNYSGIPGADSAFTNSYNEFFGNTITNCYTGISLNGASAYNDTLNEVGRINVNANTITNFGGGGNAVSGIVVSNQHSIKIANNVLSGGTGSSLTLTGISVPNQSGFSGSIRNNQISLSGSSSAANGMTGISIGSVTNGDACSIEENTISACSFTTGTTAGFTGINCNYSGQGAVNIISNTIRDNIFSTMINGSFNAIQTGGSPGGTNVSLNVISGNSVAGTGVLNGINFANTSGEISVNDNQILNNQKTGASGTLNCILFTTPVSYTAGKNIISNNFFSFASGNAPSAVLGISNQSSSGIEVISDNIIRKLFISGLPTGTITVMGIRNNNSSLGRTVKGNRIDSLYTISNATVNGISSSLSGGVVRITGNKIFDLIGGGAGSTVNGITTNNAPPSIIIDNNLIGDLKSPFSTGTNAIRGIDLSGITSVNLYFNTVYLNATGNSSAFGSSAINASVASTLDLRNNIFINLSQPGGSGGSGGVTTAYRRSSNNFGSYSSVSDNNLFYAGVPGTNNLIYCEGITGTITNPKQTISAYKSIAGLAPRDQHSITENVSFLSLAGASGNYLHVNPALLTLIEGNATPVNNITEDFDDELRNPTNPDIGADEGSFTGVGPAISSAAPVPGNGQCTATTHTLTATIVPGLLPLTAVTLNYNFNGISQNPVTMINTSGNIWQGNIPPAIPVNGIVTWSILATDGSYSQSAAGSYRDEILTLYNLSLTATADPDSICISGSTQLNADFTGNDLPLNSYCTPVHTSSTNCIYRVQFNSIDNNTSLPGGCALPAYSLFPQSGTTTTSVVRGQSYQLTITSSINSMVWVWFDFNRNGNFENAEGRLVYASALSGTTGIQIPATAAIGAIRMRLRSTIASGALLNSHACLTMNTGETEDYIINIVPEINFSWTPSSGLSNSQIANPVANISSTSTYTVSAFDAFGCTLPALTKTVTVPVVNPPSPPTAVNSTQCGTGVPGCSVTGNASSYSWYLTPSDSVPVETGNPFLTSYSINSTTTFYVSRSAGLCESGRVAVIAEVTQPDSVTINVSSPSCTKNPLSLSVTKFGNTNSYIYEWSASPSSGSGLPGILSGDSITVIPDSGGTYNYTVTATDSIHACATVKTVSVSVINSPEIASLTSNPSPLCFGSSATLKGQSSLPGLAVVGTGNLKNSRTNGWPTAYGGYYGGTKSQYLIPASELTAAGLYAGPVTSLRFTVAQLATTTTFTGYTIKLGHSNATSLTSVFETSPMTTVYGPVNYSPVPGFNTHNFSTPFYWDGVSNLLVEICFNNNSTVNQTGNVVCVSTATNYISAVHYGDNLNSIVCFIPSVLGSQMQRPNMGIGGQVYSSGAGLLSWNWQPGNLSGSQVNVSPQTSTSYSVTVTNNNTTCSRDSTFFVDVFPVPPVPSSTDSIHCGAAVPYCFASGTGGLFHWYLTPSGGNFIAGETGSSLSSYVTTATTTFYVAEFDGTCESQRVPVTEISSPTDSIHALISPGPYCTGSPITLSAQQFGNNHVYSFEWTAVPDSGSGLTDTFIGSQITINPYLSGVYTYHVKGSDGICSSISSATITVNDVPVISSSSSDLSSVCNSAPLKLEAKSFIVTSPYAIIGTGNIQNTPGTYPTPYGHAFGGAKEQYLVLASELIAAGLQPGEITSLSFDVLSIPPGGTNLLNNFSISIAATNLTSLPAVMQSGISGLSQVLIPSDYFITPGINTHPFNTNYHWDGISNLIIEVCFNNGDAGAGAIGSAIVKQSSTTFVSTIEYHLSSSPDVCTSSGGATVNTFSQRPNLFIGGLVGIDKTSTLSWFWNPGGYSGASAIAIPQTNGFADYVVTATTNQGCIASDTVSVFVNPLPSTVVAHDSSHCGNSIPLCSVTSQQGTFHWYLQAAGGSEIPNENSNHLTHFAAGSTTTFYVSVSDSICESQRIPVTEFITPADSVSISAAATVCQNTFLNLNVNHSGSSNNYTYSWTSDIGGGLMNTGGSSVPAIPAVAGNISYTVIATDSSTGCQWISRKNVESLLAPNVSVSISNDTICSGTSVMLSAAAGLSGKALKLDGINQYLVVAPSSSLNLVNNFTLEAWIYPNALNEGSGIVSKNQAFATGSYFLRLGTLAPYSGIGAGGFTETAVPLGIINANTWTHLAVVFSQLSGNNNSVTVYVNGSIASTGQTLMFSNGDSLRIGVDYGAKYFNGLIDEMRIWNNVIPTSELQFWKDRPLNNSHPYFNELVAYYDFNFPSGNVVSDLSGNGNNGILKNGASVLANAQPLSGGFTYTWSPSTDLNNSSSQNPLATPASGGFHNYNVTAIAQNGCASSSLPVGVFVQSQPVNPLITSSVNPALFCGSGSATITLQNFDSTMNVQWQTSNDGTNWNNIMNATGGSVTTGLITTAKFFRVMINCSSTVFSNVISFQVSSPSINSVTGATRCGSGTVTISATGNGTIDWYQNSSGGSLLATGNNFQTNVTSTRTFWVEARIGNCISPGGRQPVVVIVKTPPGISVTSPAFTMCRGSSTTLTVQSPNDPSYTYQWSPGNLIGNTITVNPQFSIIYSVTAVDNTQGPNGGCSVVTTAPVIINAPPAIPIINPTAPAICSGGGSVTLTISNPATGATYSWNPGNLTGTSVSVSPTVNTTYTVAATSVAGCTSTSSVTVTANPVTTPQLNISGTSTICRGESRTLNAGPGYVSYTWMAGSTNIGSSQSIIVTPQSTTTYTVVVGNGSVCTASVSQTITVNTVSQPVISTAGNPTTFCEGGSVTLDGGSGYSSYSWDNANTVVSTSQLHSTAVSGNYVLTVTAANGCSAQDSIIVTVHPNPLPAVISPSGPVTICDDGSTASLVLTAAVPPGANVVWNDLFSNSGNSYTVFYDDLNLLLNNNAYNFGISFSDANGCIGGSNLVTVNSSTCGPAELNVKAFIQGYYSGSGMMRPVLLNQGVSNATNAETDTIVVELRSNADPDLLIDSAKTIMNTDGSATCMFSHVADGATYWITVSHRNSIQVWSAFPVTINSGGFNFWDFSSAAANTYGNNVIDVYSENMWSMYSGDINQDGFVDIFDFVPYDSDNQNFVSLVYTSSDINGDGFVDIFDYVPYDSNNQNFISEIRP